MQDRELVTAEPGDRVTRAQRLLQPSRHRDEQVVADGVAEAVVDELEAVEIEQKHDRPVRDRTTSERVLDPVGEQRAVRQSGQAVVESLVSQLRLEDVAFGHVLHGDQHRLAAGELQPV